MTRQSIDAANEARREQARKHGHETYPHEYIDTVHGCTECGERLIWARPPKEIEQRRPMGVFRSCGCDGIIWRQLTGRWERISI